MRRTPLVTTLVALTAVARVAAADDATPPPAPAPAPVAASETVAAPAPAPAPEAVAATASDEAKPGPLAGFHGGNFYLRSEDDQFRLYFQGRAQIDSYNYFGPGVADQGNGTGLKSTIFLRRVRPEMTGEFLGNFQWMLAGDFGATGNDNVKGTNTAASTQSPTIRALATDVFINWKADPLFQVQVGQFDAPFTMENRTSDKYLQFMERSLAIRALGIPTNKELGGMFWGEAKDKLFFYSVGFFNGDGQGRLNPDNRLDTMGRVFVHPLNSMKGAIKDLQIGASFRYGVRDSGYVNYDYPGMSTQGGYTFFGTSYTGANKALTRIIPAGKQLGLAGELRIPIDMFDITSEFVYVKNETREALDGFQSTNSERFGAMKGYSYYVQLGFWPMGNRDINGMPGYENPTHVDLTKTDSKPKRALQVLVKWEQLNVDYDSASRSGTPDANGVDGKIKVNALSVGANYWMTKHLRFTVNYVYNMFPSSEPTSASAAGGPKWSADQRALAPGNRLGKGIDDGTRDSAHALHELLFRAAVAF